MVIFKHYSARDSPILSLKSLRRAPRQNIDYKPQKCLWLSEGNAWYKWTRKNMPSDKMNLLHWAQDVTFDESKLYRIENRQAVTNFTRKFGLPGSNKSGYIDWEEAILYLYSKGKFGIYISKEVCLYCQKKYLDHYITHTDFTSDSKYTWGAMFDIPCIFTWDPKEIITSISKRKKAVN